MSLERTGNPPGFRRVVPRKMGKSRYLETYTRLRPQAFWSTASHAVTLLISVLALCSCARTVSVGLDNARTSIGYVNSGLLPEGSIFVVERKGTASRAQQLTQQPLDTFEKQTPVQGDSLTATHLSDFGISFSGSISNALRTAVETKIASETTLNLTNFVTDRLRDPLYVLNSPPMAVWRQNTGDVYGKTETDRRRCRFLFVSGATQSDECRVSLGAPRNSPSAKFSILVYGQGFQVQYSGGRTSEWKGKRLPVLLNVNVFELTMDPSGATGYRFAYDLDSKVNVTAALNSAQ